VTFLSTGEVRHALSYLVDRSLAPPLERGRCTCADRSLGANTGVNRTRPDLTVVPRNAFKGDPLHKVDLRLSKEVPLPGHVKLMGIAEVFNLFNHTNFGNYQALVNTSTYGNPVQNSANTYLPRSGQFAFKITF